MTVKIMDEKSIATILLVDDQAENLFVLEEILSRLGQKIIKATSGQEALRHVFNNQVTVIIMDVTMPGMNGFEAAALIREREKSRHIPIIFVTGLSVRESHMFQGYSLGGVDYILKPIVPEILRAKVNVFIELFQQTEEINKQRDILQRQNEELQIEIFERKRAEQKLWELNTTLEAKVAEKTAALNQHADELARSNAELEQFAHIVSHDLQEPIRKIVNFSGILEERFSSDIDDKAKNYLNIIVDGAIRMRDLIQDLLQFSQIEHPDANLKKVDTDVLLQEILSEIEPTLAESKASVRTANLPPVPAYPTQLRRVFQNLILNAVKFRDKRAPVVEVNAVEEKDFVVFSVKDNGIGIDPKYWDRIFKVFQRLHTRKEYPGSGIGLSICKKIVERHGGKIWVESQPGHGATFFFSIPNNKVKEEMDDESSPIGKIRPQHAKVTPLH